MFQIETCRALSHFKRVRHSIRLIPNWSCIQVKILGTSFALYLDIVLGDSMKLSQLSILGFLFLTSCASLRSHQSKQENPQFTATDRMDFETMTSSSSSGKVSKDSKKSANYNPTKDHSYIGYKGFLNRPPVFGDPRSEALFQRCQPFEVTGVYQTGQTLLVYVKQGKNNFAFTGVNRKAFTVGKNKRLPLLDQHFVKDLTFASKRAVASQQKACGGQTWRQMPEDQFLFVIGDPEKRQPLKSPQGEYDVWTYQGSEETAPRHYYFRGGKLYSWTN